MGAPCKTEFTTYYGFDPIYRGGYAFGVEKMEDCLDEMIPLLADHWDETEGYLDAEMNVDYARYISMERRSMLIMFTLRDTATTLVGHLVFTITPHANVQHKLLACEQALFIHPSHRGTAVIRLLDYAEDCLRALGVHYLTIGDKSPAGGASLGKLLGKRGYRPFAITHIKNLED